MRVSRLVVRNSFTKALQKLVSNTGKSYNIGVCCFFLVLLLHFSSLLFVFVGAPVDHSAIQVEVALMEKSEMSKSSPGANRPKPNEPGCGPNTFLPLHNGQVKHEVVNSSSFCYDQN